MSRTDPEQPMWNENKDNDVEDASAAGQEVSVEEFHSSTRKRSNLSRNRSLYLRIASSLFFLIGAALYLRMAVISIQFARENEIPSFDSTISSATSSAVDVDYSLLYWNQLPAVAKAAAQDLGYDQQTWDTGTIPAEADLWWDCLSPEQMEAAMVLGYNEAEWNGVEENEIEATDTSGGTAASIEEGEYGAYTAPADPYAADDRRYTLLYIFASLCFVIVGVLDWMAVKKLYPALFVVAGLFGFISAIYVTRNVRYRNTSALRAMNGAEDNLGNQTDVIRITRQILNRALVTRTIPKQECMVELAELPLVLSIWNDPAHLSRSISWTS